MQGWQPYEHGFHDHGLNLLLIRSQPFKLATFFSRIHVGSSCSN